MHRAQVRATTRRAQIGGGVVLLAAAGLAVAPGTWAVGRGALEPVVVEKIEPRASGPEPIELPDAGLLAMALNGASPEMGRDPPPPKQGETSGSDNAEPPAPPPPPPPAWKYVGAIIGPGVRKAIVSVDDKQQFAAVGEKVREDEIVDVKPDKLVVRKGGVERDVLVAEKVDRPVSASVGGPMGNAMPTSNPSHPGVLPQPGAGGGVPNPAGFNAATRQGPNAGGAGGANAKRTVPGGGASNPANRPGTNPGARGTQPPAVPPRTNGLGKQTGRMTPAQIEEQKQRLLREGVRPAPEEGANK